MDTPTPAGQAWYRYFWPWFIVGLLVVSVAGSLWTVRIAYGLGDLEAGVTEADHSVGDD